MVDLILRKRRARAGEIGLFVDAEIFEEPFTRIKMDAEVDVKATVRGTEKYIKFSHVIAGIVADNSDLFHDKEDARDALLIDSKHVKKKYDRLRGEARLDAAETRDLDATAWLRLIRLMVYHATTTYGIPPETFEKDVRNLTPPQQPEPPPHDTIPEGPGAPPPTDEDVAQDTNPSSYPPRQAAEPTRASMDDDDDEPTVDPGKRDWSAQMPRGPDEYLTYARDQIDAAKDLASTIAWLNSEDQWQLRKTCGVTVEQRKGLEKHIQQREWTQ